MLWHASQVALLTVALTLSFWGYAQEPEPKQADSYDVLLHSRMLADQRTALTAVMHDPQKYIPRHSAEPARLSPITADQPSSREPRRVYCGIGARPLISTNSGEKPRQRKGS